MVCTQMHQLHDETNDSGPVREEVFEAKRLMINLKEFMRKEGFKED